MTDFIESAFIAAALAWVAAIGAAMLDLREIATVMISTAIWLSVVALASLLVGAIAWMIRRITIERRRNSNGNRRTR